MESHERLKIMQELGVLGIRRLVKLGGSLALIIPKEWIDAYALHTISDDGYWVKLLPTEEGNILVASLSEDELKDIAVREPA